LEVDRWYHQLDRAIMSADKPVLLIAHSLDAALSVRWLQETRCHDRVSGAFLVAIADVQQAQCSEAARLLDFAIRLDRELPVPSMMVASRNDDWLSFDRATFFARSLGSRFIDAGFAGHIGTTAKLGNWADGLSSLTDFIGTLA